MKNGQKKMDHKRLSSLAFANLFKEQSFYLCGFAQTCWKLENYDS